MVFALFIVSVLVLEWIVGKEQAGEKRDCPAPPDQRSAEQPSPEDLFILAQAVEKHARGESGTAIFHSDQPAGSADRSPRNSPAM